MLTRRLNVTLEIGQPAQSVEVAAAAPLLQTASGTVSFAVDEIKVTTLPLDGRNFIPLVALSPGVALPGGGNLFPRINGSRPRTNEYRYDGIRSAARARQVAFIRLLTASRNSGSTSTRIHRNMGGRTAAPSWSAPNRAVMIFMEHSSSSFAMKI
jgi:hypothetical protein